MIYLFLVLCFTVFASIYFMHRISQKENLIQFRLEDALPELDILYMTRVQKERFFNEEDYIRMKDFYILDKAKMELAPKDMLVLHPLPRVNEISDRSGIQWHL